MSATHAAAAAAAPMEDDGTSGQTFSMHNVRMATAFVVVSVCYCIV